MSQNQGYLIARTKSKTEFFTSSSSYDRPQWKSLREATVFPTVEMAQHALTKILKNSLAYESKLCSLKEAMTFDFPNGERATTPNRGKFAETPGGNEYPKDDLASNPGSSDDSDNGGSNDVSDEMKADDEGGACEECGHSPCTCVDSDEDGHCPSCGAELDDGHEPETVDSGEPEGEYGEDNYGDDEPPMGRKEMALDHEEEENAFSRAKFGRGQMVNYRGAKHKVLADDGTGVAIIAPEGDDSHPIRVDNTRLARVSEAEFKMPAKPLPDGQPTDNKTTAATYKSGLKKIAFDKPAMTDAPFDQGGDAHDEKVKVPSEVLSELKEVISRFAKEAEFSNTRDDARASFLTTASEAMATILALLELGTVQSIKQAQISMQSMMSPIVNHIPPSVIKFISMGGKKPTLRDLFDVKRAKAKELE